MADNRIIYEASQKLELEWIKENSISHEFADGKGIIVLKEGVTEIGESAFGNCNYLVNIKLPNCVVKIGNSAFENCSDLTSVILPDSLAEIGESVFECSGLSSIVIPDSVTEM